MQCRCACFSECVRYYRRNKWCRWSEPRMFWVTVLQKNWHFCSLRYRNLLPKSVLILLCESTNMLHNGYASADKCKWRCQIQGHNSSVIFSCELPCIYIFICINRRTHAVSDGNTIQCEFYLWLRPTCKSLFAFILSGYFSCTCPRWRVDNLLSNPWLPYTYWQETPDMWYPRSGISQWMLNI